MGGEDEGERQRDGIGKAASSCAGLGWSLLFKGLRPLTTTQSLTWNGADVEGREVSERKSSLASSDLRLFRR